MARPSIVGTPTFEPPVNTSGAAGTITIVTPSGAAIGETLVAVLASQTQSASDFTIPAGWSRFGLAAVDSLAVRILGFYRLVLTGAPAVSYTWTTPVAGGRRAGVMFRVQNADPVQPIAQSPAYGSFVSGTVTMGSITVPENDCLHLLAGSAASIQAPNPATLSASPAAMTLVNSVVAGLGTATRTALFVWQEDVDVGSSTAKTFTFTHTATPHGTGSAVILQGTGVNIPPVANAGVDQSVTTADTVTLNGAGSTDSDGTIVTYAWTQTSGTTVTLAGTGTNRTFNAPTAGVRVFQLTVTDNDGATNSDTVTITVSATGTGAIPTYVAVGSIPALTTTGSAGYPAGVAVGDLMLLFVASDSTATPTVPARWTQLGTTQSASGVGVSTFWDEANGTETGGIAISGLTAGTKGLAWAAAYRPSTSGNQITPTATVGADASTASTAISATGSSWTTVVDDLLVTMVMMATPTAFTGNATGVTATSAGSTLAAATARFGGLSGTNTLWYHHRDQAVTIGGTGAPTLTATAVGGNAGGMVSFVRLTESAAPANLPPVADAGPDQSVLATTAVTLTGAASTDSDGTIASYAWAQTSGTTVTLAGTGSNRTFTAPGTAGTLVFQLTVTDNDGATDTDTVTITVAGPGAPVYVSSGGANAGAGTAFAPAYPAGMLANDLMIMFVWSDSATTATVPAGWTAQPGTHGPAGGLYMSSWTKSALGTETGTLSVTGLTGGTRGIAWITAYRASVSGLMLGFEYQPDGDSDATSTAIAFATTAPSWAVVDNDRLFVALVVSAPTASTFSAQATTQVLSQAGATIISSTSRVAARSADNTFWLHQRDAEVTVGGTGATSFTATAVGANASGMAGFMRIFETVNVAPNADAGPDQSVLASAAVTLTGAASTDSDGTITSYAWTQTSGTTVTLAGTGANRTFTAPAVTATLVFQLTVTDNGGLTDTDTVTINVAPANVPPVANAGPDQTVAEWVTVTLTGAASTDADGTIVTYAWAQTAGTTVTLAGTGATRTFTAPGVIGGTTLTFQLTVTDDDGATGTDTVVVTVAGGTQFYWNGTAWRPQRFEHL